MTNQKHPITPPPELVEQWIEQFKGDHPIYVAIQAAQWGADQELEACCEWLDAACLHLDGSYLCSDRRPKPLSLKKQAYDALDTYIYGNPDHNDKQNTYNIIRKALEQLND